MLDEYGEPTDTEILDWREHNDHAEPVDHDGEAPSLTMAVAFVLTDGRRIEAAMLMPAGAIVQRFEIAAGGLPVVSLPFALHDDSQRYHTVCRRRAPEIDEWAV